MGDSDTHTSAWSFQRIAASDPWAAALFAELHVEYGSRYPEHEYTELTTLPPSEFAAPHGTFLILIENGQTVAGLARRVVEELEQEASARGYRRVYLTTGPRQPEARALYLSAGYTPVFDLTADPETIGPLAFEKQLRP